jgi:hypothetical protein
VALDEESQMRINEPRSPVVMEQGHCKSVRDAGWGEFDYPQEPLPEAIEVLLCLLDGAERRHRLMMRWSGGRLDPPSQAKW